MEIPESLAEEVVTWETKRTYDSRETLKHHESHRRNLCLTNNILSSRNNEYLKIFEEYPRDQAKIIGLVEIIINTRSPTYSEQLNDMTLTNNGQVNG